MIKKTVRTTTTRYVVNGREYRSLDEMPEADRRLFLDENRNGIPDGIDERLRQMGVDPSSVTTTESRSEHVHIESRTFGEDPTAGILQAGQHEAPPLPGEIRPEPDPAITLTLRPKHLFWIALLLGLAALSLWILLR